MSTPPTLLTGMEHFAFTRCPFRCEIRASIRHKGSFCRRVYSANGILVGSAVLAGLRHVQRRDRRPSVRTHICTLFSDSSYRNITRRSTPSDIRVFHMFYACDAAQTLHGNVQQVDHVPNGPTNSAAITIMFPLRLCGSKLLVAVTRGRRYGPSRLRINDDDDDDAAYRAHMISD